MATELVSTIGIRNLCDLFIDLSVEQEVYYLPKNYGGTVYIPGPYIKDFVNVLLPLIKVHFVLISGGCDMTVPDECPEEYNRLCKSEFVLCWYSQNATINTNKLRQIPIGLDFHTLFWKDYEPWGKKDSIENQEKLLITIVNDFEARNEEKINKCYINFHFNYLGSKYKQDRIDALNNIDKNIVYIEPELMKRKETWEEMVKYKYVISPHGNGLDCHRTWEALALKCIPIVKTSQMDPLFKDLSIIIVNNWNEVNEELISKYNNFKFCEYNEKIYLKYWYKIINGFKGK